MRSLGTEEKAALLLTAADDDDDDNNDNNSELINSPTKIENDNFPVIAKRPKTYQNRPTSAYPILCFALIMGTFVVGCFSGVIIMSYRGSQDFEQGLSSNSLQLATKIDLSIRKKLFQSITPTNFQNLNQ
jgi:hypothetical protein